MWRSHHGAAEARATLPPVQSPLVDSLVLPGRFGAVLFDMDGLLIDSEPLWAEAEAELLERHGDHLTAEDRTATHGRAMADSAKVYAARLPGTTAAELEAELFELMRRRYQAGAPLHRGAGELVRGLVGKVRLGVATSTTAPLVEVALQGVGLLDAFEIVVSGADLGRGKPDPAVFIEGCRRLGTDPHHAVAFEDSPVGVMAAHAAGMYVVGVPDRPGVEPRLVAAGADLLIDSLADVVVEGS
jgi:HAD superfamily hydrolase (TIGR01509 family)